MILISILTNVFMALPALADNPEGCEKWVKDYSVTCVFAGEDASLWRRDCGRAADELKCKRNPGNRPYGAPCLNETICTNENPNLLGQAICTNWVREDGISCGNSKKPRAWARACTWAFVPERACTEFRKSYPSEDDYVY